MFHKGNEMPENNIDLAVILGDGVGHDILPVAVEVIKEAAGVCGVEVTPTVYGYGAQRYLEEGSPLPEDVPALVAIWPRSTIRSSSGARATIRGFLRASIAGICSWGFAGNSIFL